MIACTGCKGEKDCFALCKTCPSFFEKIQKALDWMIKDIDFKNRNSDCHIEDSKELKEAREVLKKLKG